MPIQTHPRSRARRSTPRSQQDAGPRTGAATGEPQPLDIDLAVLAVAFGQRLHEADLPVTPAQSEHYALSLTLTRPRSLRRLYFTTRAVFVTEAEQTAAFDRVFEDVFGVRVGLDGDREVTIAPVLDATQA